jgi:hypothetical protein
MKKSQATHIAIATWPITTGKRIKHSLVNGSDAKMLTLSAARPFCA